MNIRRQNNYNCKFLLEKNNKIHLTKGVKNVKVSLY